MTDAVPPTDNVIELPRKAALATVLAVAKEYPVFPCHPKMGSFNGKSFTAKSPRTAHGFDDATTDSAITTKRWTHQPDSLVGVPTGRVSGFVVLDIDPQGEAWFENHKHGLVPTRIHRTPRGFHLLFNDSLLGDIKNSAGSVAPGVDIRGDGGYVIWWPAHGYQIENDAPIAELPGWLFDLVVKHVSGAAEDNEDDILLRKGRTRHTLYEAVPIIDTLDPDMEHDEWLNVGFGLHHQFGDMGDAGLQLWDGWSAKATKPDKYRGLEHIRTRWRKFASDTRADAITFRTILAMANKVKEDKDATRIEFRHVADIVDDKRQPEWLLVDILEAGVLALIAGSRGTFKSFIALHWAMTAALAGHGVVILSGEGAGLDRRIDAWHRTHQPGLTLRDLPMVALERVLNLTQTEIVARLAEAIASSSYAVKLVLIDTLSKYTPGIEENSNKEMAEFLFQLAVMIRDALEVTVLLVAHTGHGNQERPRGAYALMANTEAEYMVQRRDPDSMMVTVTRERFKDTPSLPPLTYMADIVDLERTDADDRPVTSLVLHPIPNSPAVATVIEPSGKRQKLIYGLIKAGVGPDGIAAEAEVIKKAVEALPLPTGPDVRDVRKMRANEILVALAKGGWVNRENGHLRPLR